MEINRRLLEQWPRATDVYLCYFVRGLSVNFTLCVNSQRLYVLD